MFALLTAHTLAAIVTISLVNQSWVKVLLLVGVGASLAYCRRPQYTCEYSFRPDGQAEYIPAVIASSVRTGKTTLANALTKIYRVDDVSRLLGSMMTVRFKHTPASQTLILLPDSFVHPDDYRRVRLWFKWQGKGVANDNRDDLAVRDQDSI
jgi:hypothetical protein